MIPYKKWREKPSWSDVMVITGEDLFQHHEFHSLLQREFSYRKKFYLDETSLSDLTHELSGYDLFASVEEGETALLLKNADKTLSEVYEGLSDLLKNKIPEKKVFLYFDKLDKRKKWIKELLSFSELIEMAKPPERDMLYWKKALEKKHQLTISSDVWDYLRLSHLDELSLMSQEIDKFKLLLKSGEPLQLTHVNELGVSATEIHVFQFMEGLLRFDVEGTWKKWKTFSSSADQYHQILALMIRYFRTICRLLPYVKQGIRDGKLVASEVGGHPFFLTQIIKKISLSHEELYYEALGWLGEVDEALKSGQNTLEELFLLRYLARC